MRAPAVAILVLSLAGCQGSINASGASRSGAEPERPAGSGTANSAGRGGSSPSASGAGGNGASTDPNVERPTRFECTEPETRGQGQLAMRRLTRDELLDSLAAVLGSDVLSAEAVERATARIPLESPQDLVATFQNGHAYDHVEGILLSAEAIAAQVAGDAKARARVFGDCADTADSACAEAFLDGTGLRLLRRPLAPERRATLLAAFTSEGAGLTGLRWLLARLLQSPELVFHLELPRQRCDRAPAAAPATFAWDDEAVFFAPVAGSQQGPQQQLTEMGWYVWQLPGARVPDAYAELRLELSAVSGDGAAIEVDVNLDDRPLLPGLTLTPGDHTLMAEVAIEAGADTKVGVYFKNPVAGRALALGALTFAADPERVACEDEPPQDGHYGVDDYAVASRIAYGLTGEGPDAALLEAAARGELATEAQALPHAERLIATPAARRQFEAIIDAWLNLHAIPTPHDAIAERAGVDPVGLAEEARRELLDFAGYMVFERGADAAELMEARVGFPRSARLAKLYGSKVATGDELVELTRGHGGLLMRIAPLLSGQLGSSPILRGVYVRKRLLCDELPSPDFTIVNARVQMFESEDRTRLSTREAVTEITSSGACPTCHVRINPLGFALETFNPLGQPRTEEIVFDPTGAEIARHPIDTRVQDANLEDGAPSELDGAAALNAALAQSGKVRACIAERLYTHAHLRPAAPADACALSEVEQRLREGASIKEAWLRAVINPELFLRAAEEPMP